jgi:hypothetical protein
VPATAREASPRSGGPPRPEHMEAKRPVRVCDGGAVNGEENRGGGGAHRGRKASANGGGHGHEVKRLIGTLDMGGCHGPVGTVTPRVTESLMKSLKLQLSLTARAKQVVKI